MSVLRSPGEDGQNRIALAPIAGAFSSGFVGAANYRDRDVLGLGLRHSGAVYGWTFGSAVLHEFKPDLLAFSNKLLARFK